MDLIKDLEKSIKKDLNTFFEDIERDSLNFSEN